MSRLSQSVKKRVQLGRLCAHNSRLDVIVVDATLIRLNLLTSQHQPDDVISRALIFGSTSSGFGQSFDDI